MILVRYTRCTVCCAGLLLFGGCAPFLATSDTRGKLPPLEEGDDGLPLDEEGLGEEPEPLAEPENILDPTVRPDWLGLATGFSRYRGIPSVVGIGTAKAEGELPMARLVARRRARAGVHGVGQRTAAHLAKKVRMNSNARLLLETQFVGLLDVLLPDQRRFVPTWEDQRTGRIYAAILIPLDRFLTTIRDDPDVPEGVRNHLRARLPQVVAELAGG